MIADRPLHGLLPPDLGPIHPRRSPGLEGLANGPALVARFGHDRGDAPAAHPVWDIEADHLGRLCAQLALTPSPRRIVLGGGNAARAPVRPIRARTRHWLGGYLARDSVEGGIEAYIVPPGLGDRSGILGALMRAMGAASEDRPAN